MLSVSKCWVYPNVGRIQMLSLSNYWVYQNVECIFHVSPKCFFSWWWQRWVKNSGWRAGSGRNLQIYFVIVAEPSIKCTRFDPTGIGSSQHALRKKRNKINNNAFLPGSLFFRPFACNKVHIRLDFHLIV